MNLKNYHQTNAWSYNNMMVSHKRLVDGLNKIANELADEFYLQDDCCEMSVNISKYNNYAAGEVNLHVESNDRHFYLSDIVGKHGAATIDDVRGNLKAIKRAFREFLINNK